VTAAEALGRFGWEDDLAPALDRLLSRASLDGNDLFTAVAALNALDYLDDRARGAVEAIRDLPREQAGIRRQYRSYVPQLVDKILADLEIDASAAQLVFTDAVRFPALVNDTPAHFVYTDYGVPDYYWMLILTEANFAHDNPNTVCRFLRATAKGIDTYLDNPDPANAYIFAENEWLPLEVHAAMGENLREFWKDPGTGRALWQDAAVWQAAHDWALETGLISLDNDPSVYFTNEFLPPELQ